LVIKYLAGDRLQGTAAERAALTTSSGGWTSVGGGVVFNTTTHIITNGTSGSRNRIYQQLSETLGNAFVITFNWTRTSASGNNTRPLLVSSTTDAPTNDQGQDALGVYMDTNGNYLKVTDGTHAAGFVFTPTQNVVEYVAIRRTTATHMDIRVYSSDAYTGSAQHYGDVTITSAISGLQYIMSANGEASSGLHTSAIENIKVYNTSTIPPSSGDKIFDSDTSGPTYTYPNLPNGAIFEESDTGNHYMFDGTDTWNEIT